MKPQNKPLVRGDVSLDTSDFGTQGNPWDDDSIEAFMNSMEDSLLEFMDA